jgi:hypothetical protein
VAGKRLSKKGGQAVRKGSITPIVVPFPELLETSSEPPICSIRSRIPRIPKWPFAANC